MEKLCIGDGTGADPVHGNCSFIRVVVGKIRACHYQGIVVNMWSKRLGREWMAPLKEIDDYSFFASDQASSISSIEHLASSFPRDLMMSSMI